MPAASQHRSTPSGFAFSEELNTIDASAPANYELRNSGPNGLFGDGDDAIFTVLPSFELGASCVLLTVLDGALPEGNYRLTVFSHAGRSLHDTAGLALDGNNDGFEGGNYVREFTVVNDTLPPDLTVNSLVTNCSTPTLTGTVEDAHLETLIVILDGIEYTPVVTQPTWALSISDPLPEGTYPLKAIATDLLGHSTTCTGELVIDMTAPEAPVVSGIADDTGPSDSDGITSDTTLWLSGTGEASSVLTVFHDGMPIGTVIVQAGGNWSYDHTGVELPQGMHEFMATATDAAGNTSDPSPVLRVTVDTTAPTDIALTPNQVAENLPAGTVVGIFSSDDSEPFSASFLYELVPGEGDDDNWEFTIFGDH
jgi:hypothetical protein